MSADLETILVYLQRRYNILREVCSLTEELAEAVERGDTVSASLMDFSLLSPLEFFVVPKNGDGRNNKPPAMRVRVDCYTKNHLSVYNRVVQAVLQKGKVIYGEERKFTCAYEMDVQISYRLHT